MDEVAVSAIQDMKCHPTGEVADEVHVAEQIHLEPSAPYKNYPNDPCGIPSPPPTWYAQFKIIYSRGLYPTDVVIGE